MPSIINSPPVNSHINPDASNKLDRIQLDVDVGAEAGAAAGVAVDREVVEEEAGIAIERMPGSSNAPTVSDLKYTLHILSLTSNGLPYHRRRETN